VRKRNILNSNDKKLEITGSIRHLLDKTSEYEFRSGRRLSNRSLNSSINIFSDEYHNDRSPKPTAKKFINYSEIVSQEPGAGLKTKFQIADTYKANQELATHTKRKIFPEKIQAILGGSST
jgi:hypothetical protein